MPDHSKIGRNSKAKGSRYERHVAQLLTEHTKTNFRRTPGSGGFNRGGLVVAGHIFCGDLMCDNKDFKYSVEAKNRAGFSFEAILKNPGTAPFTQWWFQAVRDADKYNLCPIMFFKSKSSDFVAVPYLVHKDLIGYGMVLYQYANEVSFSIVERAEGSKIKAKHNVRAILPVPLIMSWYAWVEHSKYDMFNIEMSSESKGRILEYT